MESRSLIASSNGNRSRTVAMPRARANGKRDRRAKQAALIRAATKLFATRGYEATTTREIAALAGCAEGLIHRYFRGKAGLLFALMRAHAAEEAVQLSARLPRARALHQEIQQLLEWELNRMWKERDFLRVTIPRAILDRRVGQFVSRVGPGRHAKAIGDRLKHYQGNGTALPDEDIEALANAIGALGFAFGFMRQVVFGFNREQTKALAARIAAIFSRGLQHS
jgi:AcrR family transcriptional regulator